MNESLAREIALQVGATELNLNGAVPRITFTLPQLTAYSQALADMLGMHEPEAGPIVTHAFTQAWLDGFELRDDAVSPARPQRVTSDTWTLVDGTGAPMIRMKGGKADTFDCLGSDGDLAQAVADLVLWDANGTNPRFPTLGVDKLPEGTQNRA
jgi:hypothetical protein